MGIVHVAIYDAAVAIKGKYRPYSTAVDPSPKAKLRTKSGWPSWVAWRLGEDEWKPYGAANSQVRPSVPGVVPSSWWTRLAAHVASAPEQPSTAAAIATAAYETLVGLQPTLRLDRADRRSSTTTTPRTWR